MTDAGTIRITARTLDLAREAPVGRKERGMSEPDYTIIGSGGWELAEPTIGLRFLNGRLQQAWTIRSAAVSRVEWRDVPDATPQPGDAP